MTSVRPAFAMLLIAPIAAAMVGCEPPVETTGNGGAASGGDAVSDGGNAAPPVDPWGPMPKTVDPNYFTEFEAWVGKPLASQPLARIMTRPIPEYLKNGRGFVMFYRADCEHCHQLLEQWFTESLPAPTVAVEVPDTDPANAMPFPSELVDRRKFPKGPNYVISTPALFAVKDGVVTGFASDPDDPDAVEACLASNAE